MFTIRSYLICHFEPSFTRHLHICTVVHYPMQWNFQLSTLAWIDTYIAYTGFSIT